MLLLLAAGVASVAARAATCDGPTQLALDRCAEAARTAADLRLNRAYDRLLGRLRDPADRTRRDALRAAERAWIAFRDAECGFETAESDGGSLHAMALAQCAARLSDARADALAAIADCSSGDRFLVPIP